MLLPSLQLFSPHFHFSNFYPCILKIDTSNFFWVMILTSSLLCLCVDSKNLETILFIRVKSLPVITFPFVHSFSFPGVSDCLFFSYTICLCRIFNLKRKQNKQTRKHFLRAGMAVRVGWGGRCTVQVMRDRIYYRSCTISHLHHMWENYLSRAHTHPKCLEFPRLLRPPRPRALLPKVWSMDQHHRLHPGLC